MRLESCFPVVLGCAALTACFGSTAGLPRSTSDPLPSLARPARPLARGAREIRFTASWGLGGSVPVLRVVRTPDGLVTGEMLVTIARASSDTEEYAREQRARYAREYGCSRWVPEDRNRQLCRAPFTRGEPAWPAVLATLDSLMRHPPPSEVAPPIPSTGRRDEGSVERLPTDRVTRCLDGSTWEIVKWAGRQERRVSPPSALPGCGPMTEAGKAYAKAGWDLLEAVIDAARLGE